MQLALRSTGADDTGFKHPLDRLAQHNFDAVDGFLSGCLCSSGPETGYRFSSIIFVTPTESPTHGIPSVVSAVKMIKFNTNN